MVIVNEHDVKYQFDVDDTEEISVYELKKLIASIETLIFD